MLYMNQKTYDEISDAVIFKRPPIFIAQRLQGLHIELGVMGINFGIDDNLPDNTLYLNATDTVRIAKLESIKCKLKAIIPELVVV